MQAPSLARRADAVRLARLRRDPLPGDPRGPRAPHEDRPDRLSRGRSARGSSGSIPGSWRWPTGSTPPPPGAATRRCPIEPDQVLREMWENPKRGYDPVLVKALINLIGIYPVGTCVILDTLEVAIVYAPNPDATLLNRPLVRIAIDANGGAVPPPGTLVDLADQDGPGQLRAVDRQGDQPDPLRPRRSATTLSEPRSRPRGPGSGRPAGPALITYLTAGFPVAEASRDALQVADGARRHHRGGRALQRPAGRRAHHPAQHLRRAASRA